MKKKFMSVVLAIAMMCTMVGNLTAFALPTVGIETYCTVKTVDKNGSAVTGVKITGCGENCVADGENIHCFSSDKTGGQITFDFSEVPDGYKMPSGISVTTSELDQGNINDREDVSVTKRDNVSATSCDGSTITDKSVYDLVFTLEEYEMETYDFYMNYTVKGTNISIGEVKYKLVYGNTETEEYSSKDVPAVSLPKGEQVTLVITKVPEGYTKPNDVTFTAGDMSRDAWEAAGYSTTNGGNDYATDYDCEPIEKDIALTVKLQNESEEDVSFGYYSVTYCNEIFTDGATDTYCDIGTQKTITSYEHTNITVEVTSCGTYDLPDKLEFRAGEIDELSGDNYTLTKTDDGEYVLTFKLTGGFSLPSGNTYYSAKVKAVDESGNTVSGATFSLNDNAAVAADGETTSDISAGLGAVSLKVTAPAGYESPEMVYFSGSTIATDLTGDFSGTVSGDGQSEDTKYVCDIKVVLHEATEDTETEYTIEFDGMYTDIATIECEQTKAKAGDEVTVKVSNVTEGYNPWTLVVAEKANPYNDSVVSYQTPVEDGTYVYKFNMPAYNIKFGVNIFAITYIVDVKAGTTKENEDEIAESGLEYTLKVGDKTYTQEDAANNLENHAIKLSYTDGYQKEATLTITAVPAGYKMPAQTTKTFTITESFTEDDTFKVRDDGSDNYYIVVILEQDDNSSETDSPFTVKADVNTSTTDRDTEKDGIQVNAKDTVKIDVVVDGGKFTNADWEMIYDPTLFKYVGTTVNVDQTKATLTLDDTKFAVLSGLIYANAGTTNDNEFDDKTAIVTYEFEAKTGLSADKTGTFKIESAHANNYVIAGTQENKVAKTKDAEVEIVLVKDSETEEGEQVTPAGSIENATKEYNAQMQAGNEFVLDEKFADATLTYAAAEEGKEKEELKYKTTLPTWKDVGTYTYYVKITGDGLKTTYVGATLTITPAKLTPSVMFEVDPDVTGVNFVPTLEGVLDGTHNGTVNVTYTNGKGDETTVALNASDFVYDGETTSVWNGKAQDGSDMTFKIPAQTSGEFTVKVDYVEGENDNYTGEENSESVEVDKIFADEDTVDALEETITSVFGYDATPHSLEIDEDAVKAVTSGKWKYTISDTDATVTNVGDDKLIKVVFEDENGKYNDVIVYAVLKVTPANVKITVADKEKFMNEDDPELTGTIQVVDEEGNAVEGMDANQLYGEDDLEVAYEREIGEAVGTYDIRASYVPNNNYTVTVEEGTFTIKEPVIDNDKEDAVVKVEVVDLSYETDGTPDYIAGKRLVLVYTDVDKLFYGYGTKDNYEKMFDVTAAGYKYTKYTYGDAGTSVSADEEDKAYRHVYGIVVDKLESDKKGAELESEYISKVVFIGNDVETMAPENIVYDGNINMSKEIDINDYSMANGIYNDMYDRATYIRSILKADINHDKKVDTSDVADVKAIYEAKTNK